MLLYEYNASPPPPPQAFAKYLRTLTNIAKFHSFDWLREVAESLAR